MTFQLFICLLKYIKLFCRFKKGKLDKKLLICVQGNFWTSSLFVNIHLTIKRWAAKGQRGVIC